MRAKVYYSDHSRFLEESITEEILRQERAKLRGKTFINLYCAVKQLVDNFPGRFPYLEYDVREIEKHGLAPKIDTHASTKNNKD